MRTHETEKILYVKEHKNEDKVAEKGMWKGLHQLQTHFWWECNFGRHFPGKYERFTQDIARIFFGIYLKDCMPLYINMVIFAHCCPYGQREIEKSLDVLNRWMVK